MRKEKNPLSGYERTYFESRVDMKQYCSHTAHFNWTLAKQLSHDIQSLRDDCVRGGNARYFTSSGLGTFLAQLDMAIKKVKELMVILDSMNNTRAWEYDEVDKNEVHGYKMFDKNWTCSINGNTKKYTCPGRFREFGEIKACGHGMHFCKNLEDCLAFYKLGAGRIAEVVAHGKVETDGKKSCTNDLEIVREISLEEAFEILNFGGKRCTGIRNIGDYNTGNDNYGSNNSGDRNYGFRNTGYMNFGNQNSGQRNTGSYNTGDENSGLRNTGNCNDGSGNTGNHNKGNHNTGDWNVADFTTGYFMTRTDDTVKMFNEESSWSRRDFIESKACKILMSMPNSTADLLAEEPAVDDCSIGNKFKMKNGDTVCERIITTTKKQEWWDSLSNEKCMEIFNLPNFDPEIFKECTDIDVRKKYRRLVLTPQLHAIFNKFSSRDAFSQFVLSEWNDEIDR